MFKDFIKNTKNKNKTMCLEKQEKQDSIKSRLGKTKKYETAQQNTKSTRQRMMPSPTQTLVLSCRGVPEERAQSTPRSGGVMQQ
jgi:hypothetical protein